MSDTQVGKIHLGVEIEPEFNGDSKAQMKKIADILARGLAKLGKNMKLDVLEKVFEECFKNMNEVMNQQLVVMKENMRAFIEGIRDMLANSKFNFGPITYDEPQSDAEPTQTSSTTNTARGPPKVKIKMPKVDLSQMSKQGEMDLLSQKILNTEELLNAQRLQLKQYSEELENLNDINDEKSGMSQELSDNIAKLKQLKIGIADVKQRMSEMSTMGEKTQGKSLIYILEKEITKVTQDIDYLRSKLSELGKIDSASGIEGLTVKIGKLKSTIVDSETYLSSMKRKLNELSEINQPDLFAGSEQLLLSLENTLPSFDQLKQSVNEAASRIKYLNSITLEAARNHELFGIILNGIRTSHLANGLRRIRDVMISFASGGMTGGLNHIGTAITGLASKFMATTNVGAKLASLMERFPLTATLVTNAYKRLGSVIANTLVTGMQRLSNGFKSGVKHAANFTAKLLGVSNASKKASKGMNNAGMSLGRLVRSFFIFSLIFPLVSRGIMALGQSLGATLMTNETFVRSLDQIKSNLWAAFMPIYNAVLPALNALASALANITAHIASFISSLFGTTYTASINAAKGMVAAKDAMGAYGASAKKAAKDANASVMAFDHLNKLNGKKDSDGSGGSEMPNIIPTDVDTAGASKLAEKIKKMFADEDYEGIGEMIGQGINKGVSKITQYIDWANVGGKITSVIDAFARIFNSAVATVDWHAAGAMVGTGVNTLANTVRTFFEKINWTLLGQSLAKGLNGIVHTVNWRNIGETLGSRVMAAVNGLYGFAMTADWPGIGKALADSIMGLVNYVDLGKLGTLLGTSIQGMISTVHNFVTNIDWRGLGFKIGSSIENFFASVNWGELGLTFSRAVSGLLNTLRTAIASISWEQIGYDIADFLCNIDWIGLLIDVAVLIGQAFIGLTSTILGFVGKLAYNIVQGFFDGILEFFGDPFGWIKEHIVDPFVTAIKDLFGIHSPSTVMLDIGSYLIQGLLNGIANLIPNLISNVTSWFGDIANKITETWDNVKSWTSQTWTNITTTISSKVTSIKEGIANGFSRAKDAVITTCGNIKDNVVSKFNEITGWIGGIKDDLWSKAKETFTRYCDGVKSIDIKGAVSSTIGGAIDWVKGLANDAVTWGADMMSGMAQGIKDASSWVGNAVSGVADKISSWLHFSRPDVGPLREYEKWMPDMMMGLSRTLEQKSPLLIGSVRNLATKLSDTMQGVQPSVAWTGQTTVNDQYTNNYVNSDDMILMLLKEIVGLLKNNGNGGGGTTAQEIVVKIGDTELARVVIAAIKKYEKETGKQVLVA